MADSPVFDYVCDELQEGTGLDRLESRGTVRIALKSAGLNASTVGVEQMSALLRKLLPAELEARGIEDGGLCERIAQEIERRHFDVAPDRASKAAAIVRRFGR